MQGKYLHFHLLKFTDCYYHGNYYGMNTIGVVENLVKAEDCQLKCQRNENCMFWTWNKANEKCEYKDIADGKSPKSVENPSVISGPKYCGQYISHKD